MKKYTLNEQALLGQLRLSSFLLVITRERYSLAEILALETFTLVVIMVNGPSSLCKV